MFALIYFVILNYVHGLKLMKFAYIKRASSLFTSSRSIQNIDGDDDYNKGSVIIGSGPVGLATGIMLARNGYTNIKIFDQLSQPARPDDMNFWGKFRSERSYNIGITGRGILAFKNLDCWDSNVAPYTAETYGSVVWSPESKIDKPSLSKQERRYNTRCIERDRLTGCLLEVINKNYSNAISVEFNTKCVDTIWHNVGHENEYCSISIQRKTPSNDVTTHLNTSFLIGSDGSNSIIKDCLINIYKSGIQQRRYPDTNVYVYRTIPLEFPRKIVNGFCPPEKDMSYSIRANDGFNLEALPTKEGIHLGVVLFKPSNTIMSKISNYSDAYQYFEKYFPMALPYIPREGIERFATAENSKFQQFSYVYPNLHYSQSTVLLGDCIHTVKPFFGLGVNSGLEDVMVLQESLKMYNNTRSLDNSNKVISSQQLSLSLKDYSHNRAKEAKALVEISQRFDRGLIYFLLPLLVDRFFNKLFPNFFEGSIIAGLSDETRSFTQTLKRKSRERILQFAMVSSSLLLVGKLIVEVFFRLYKVLFR